MGTQVAEMSSVIGSLAVLKKERKKKSDRSMPKNGIFETAETYVILNLELLSEHTCGALLSMSAYGHLTLSRTITQRI